MNRDAQMPLVREMSLGLSEVTVMTDNATLVEAWPYPFCKIAKSPTIDP